jgi:amino-acid N-acetyltransferase
VIQTEPIVAWLREAGPYIESFRGKTFVVLLSDEHGSEVNHSRLVEDLCLLHALDVKLVLVQSTRHAINRHVTARGVPSEFHATRRITDGALLIAVQEIVGQARLAFRGLYTRAMHRNRGTAPMVSGAFVTAKPLGVHGGVDHQFTGSVRKIDIAGIHAQLDLGAVVYLDHLAHAPSGQLYNLASEEVASQTAIALHADKLILFGPTPTCVDLDQTALTELTSRTLDRVLPAQTPEMQRRLNTAAIALRGGVKRCHLVHAATDGALLTELLTVQGSGTMVTGEATARVRPARLDDLSHLLHLMQPLEEAGSLVRRSREQLEAEIQNFMVMDCDGRILGSAALYPLDTGTGELAALAVDPDHTGVTIGTQLLHAIEHEARNRGLQTLCVLTTLAPDWFSERGFVRASLTDLPDNRKAMYNFQRNSLILTKAL